MINMKKSPLAFFPSLIYDVCRILSRNHSHKSIQLGYLYPTKLFAVKFNDTLRGSFSPSSERNLSTLLDTALSLSNSEKVVNIVGVA